MLVQHNESDGQILISNDADYQQSGKTWNLVATVQSLKSTADKKEDSIEFSIEWRDPCSYSELDAPAFADDSPTEFFLFDTLEIPFSSLVDLTYGKDCGGYTNDLVYVSGPAADSSQPQGADLTQFVVGESSADNYLIEGLINDPAWIGTHSFKIVSRNGILNQELNRGEKGLFGSAESEVFTFEIKHPCSNTQFDDWTLEPIEVSLKADSKSVTLTEPQDQASLDYGDKDGFSLCGKRSISIVTPASEYESFLTFESPNKLIIAATLDKDLGPHSVTVRVALDDYPDILPSETFLSINIGACQIESLSATQVPA